MIWRRGEEVWHCSTITCTRGWSFQLTFDLQLVEKAAVEDPVIVVDNGQVLYLSVNLGG